MIKNYDQSVEINCNPNWPYIPDHPYRISIIGGSRSRKINVLLNLWGNIFIRQRSTWIKVSTAY